MPTPEKNSKATRSARIVGFIVFEHCEDFEQALSLDTSDGTPAGGLLDWREKKDAAALFPSREAARKAINRTDHYRQAFSTTHPERKYCKIVPVKPV